MGCVILLVESEWKMWYSSMLKPNTHYIPIKKDLSDLLAKIKWCRYNDDKCKIIANNAKKFYNKYLQKDGILDYMQNLFIGIKQHIGFYLYNSVSPLDNQITREYSIIKNHCEYPNTKKTVADINTIQIDVGRSYGLLEAMRYIFNFVNQHSDFETIAKSHEEIFKNKLGIIRKFTLANYELAVKTTDNKQKRKEHIHETFVALQCINKLCRFIPNFVYIFGLYEKADTINVVTEYIHGITLYDYIKSDKFNMQEYLSILLQLSLALKVAQNRCCFIHYDLTPWNIIIQKLETPVYIDYVIDYNKVYRIQTDTIPVIIDFGKSHIIDNNEHHGFINMYKFSNIQDIISLLITSFNQILSEKYLNVKEIAIAVHAGNFLSNTQYQKKQFKNIKDFRTFLILSHKYTDIISTNKHELELLDPLDFIYYINRCQHYKFTLNLSNHCNGSSIIDTSNSEQLFHYILSDSLSNQTDTFMDAFKNVESAVIKSYYDIQRIENLINSVKNSLLLFLKTNKIDNK